MRLTNQEIKEKQQLPFNNIIHWVSILEAQPEKRDTYFCCDSNGDVGFRTWKDTFWEGDNIVGYAKVTYWTVINLPDFFYI